jgi:superfamily I DNA/RNA helicase
LTEQLRFFLTEARSEMTGQLDTEQRYKDAKNERDKHVDKVLASVSRKKVVVAGPGTGKTYLFKRVLESKGKSLTLTFVNSLVDDLSIDLYGLSEVRTLHGFARGLLQLIWKKESINVFPGLSRLIEEDLRLLAGEKVNFNKIFHTRDDHNTHIEFYKRRKKYYDDSYGYPDIVFAAAKFLEEHPDRIPIYDQIVVDEFQDFNQLEVSLIDLLSQRSPVLIAGDDDQALYDFKDADSKHIRARHDGNDPGYEAFNLPFCSRCTRVVVDAANDIVKNAKAHGLLKGRIEKPYEYFDDKEKDAICGQHATITYTQRFVPQFAWFIQSKLDEMAKSIRGKFTVLILSPTRDQAQKVATALKKKGFEGVEFVEKPEDRSLLDGLKILLKNKSSNLGWRIVVGELMKQQEDDLKSLLDKSNIEHAPPIQTLVSPDHKKTTRQMLAVLRKVRNDQPIEEVDFALLELIGAEPYKLGLAALNDELESHGRAASPGLRQLPIRATTVQGSKGLAADVVFLTHFDDRFFINKEGITDKDVCSFLVALTRAKKKVFLMSSQRKSPTFLQWIAAKRITLVE